MEEWLSEVEEVGVEVQVEALGVEVQVEALETETFDTGKHSMGLLDSTHVRSVWVPVEIKVCFDVSCLDATLAYVGPLASTCFLASGNVIFCVYFIRTISCSDLNFGQLREYEGCGPLQWTQSSGLLHALSSKWSLDPHLAQTASFWHRSLPCP